MDNNDHLSKKARLEAEVQPLEGSASNANLGRYPTPKRGSKDNASDGKRLRLQSVGSSTPTPKRGERLSQSDRDQIRSFLNGVCLNLDTEDSEQMAKYYYYHKQEIKYYYQLQVVAEEAKVSSDSDIKLVRHTGKGILVARIASFPLGCDDAVLIHSTRQLDQTANLRVRAALEALLQDSNFQKVIEHVKTLGYWGVPSDLLKSISILSSFKEVTTEEESIPPEKICKASKAFFTQFPLMLEKFCRLKIRELIQYATTKEYVEVSTEVKLSIILVERTQVRMIEANIQFDKSKQFAITLLKSSDKMHPSLMEILNQSSWLQESSDKKSTHIRFSNVPIEDDVALSYFLSKKINYGLLPDEVEKKAAQRSSNVNFWEAVAYKRKKREDVDWREIDEVQSELEVSKSKIASIHLTEAVTNLANFRDGIQQKIYIDKILQNQRLVMGTLLHLPTGFGKTFVILMAMAEHRNKLFVEKQRLKPYLVVVKAKNVAQSWDDNFERLNHIKASDPNTNIFNLKDGENASYKNFCDDAPSNTSKSQAFREYFLSQSSKAEIVVSVTSTALKRSIDDIFLPVLVTDGKDSDFSFDILETLKFVVILSEKGYIIGDEDYWKEQLAALVNDINSKLIPLLKEIQINDIWQQLGSSSEDFFYPKGRRESNLANKANLKTNRRKFQQQHFETLKKSNEKVVALVRTLCGSDEMSEEDSGNLYDRFTLYYRAKHLFKALNSAEGIDLTSLLAYPVKDDKNILQLLTEYKDKQNQAVKNYEQFRNCFSGIVIDESEQVLVANSQSSKADKTNKEISVTSILLDMSRYYLNTAIPSSSINPLVLAASATPWPNNMREFSLHMKFLLPRLIDQHSALHDTLFKAWNSFESTIDKFDKELDQMTFNREVIEQWFQKWVRTLFRVAVAYEAPQSSVTNLSEEEIVFVECKEDIYNIVHIKNSTDGDSAEADFMGMIGRFYAGVLNTTPIISSEPEDNSIFKKLIYGQKNAFYIRSHVEAALLAKQITDYFASEDGDVSTDEVQIGFFYEDTFVKKPFGVPQHYANITYNTDRNFNRNAFNNIVRLNDFYKYLEQYLRISRRPVWDNVFHEVKLFEKFSESSGDQLIKKIEENIGLFIPSESNLSAWQGCSQQKKILGEFIKFLRLIVDIERYSEQNLIMEFFDELKKFKYFFPKEFQKEKDLKKGFYDFRIKYTEAFKKFSGSSKQDSKGSFPENGPYADNPFQGFIYQFLHYLIKICQSNFFIFGDAGTSGMRIDADRLVVLSGTWTEGRLTQVKGRVGRAKGNENRKCIIYLPITNTIFEYLILRYYVKKAHCNDLITRASAMDFSIIADPLFLSREIYGLYCRLKENQAYIDTEVHEKVKKNISDDQSYLSLGPYEKAIKIVPDEIRKSLELFNQQLSKLPKLSQLPTLEYTPVDLPEEQTSGELLGSIDEEEWWPEPEQGNQSWGEAFSEWIALYAECHGWVRQLNEFNAGSILRALVPKQNIMITQIWSPTDTVLQEDEIYSKTTESSNISGPQSQEVYHSLILSLNLPHNGGVIKINTNVIEDSLKRDTYTQVEKRNGQKKLLTYATKESAVKWPKEMPDELYIELTVAADVKVTQIDVGALEIGGKKYELYGELAGGNSQAKTHFWTYRSGEGVCYELDDLQSIVKCRAGEATPRNPQSRIFRFLASKELDLLKTLRPKQLINRDNNCYINAAFQLADSEALRAAIITFKNQQLPNLPLDSVKQLVHLESESGIDDVSKEGNKRPEPPKIFPYKPELYAYSSSTLSQFVKPGHQQIILFMPTRGVTSCDQGDGRIDGDIDPYKWVNNFTSILRSDFPNYQIILILGLNVEFDSVSELSESSQLNSLLQSLKKIPQQNQVLVVPAPFSWQTQDRLLDKKSPLGQMRNYCLQKAKEIYNDLITIQKDPQKIALMSMDGDTELTERSFGYLIDQSNCYRFTIKTGGYHMVGTEMFDDEAKSIPNKAISKMTEEEWSIYWIRFVNYFSNKISGRLAVDMRQLVGFSNLSGTLHFGYCSEPAIYVSPLLTNRLFMSSLPCESFMNFNVDNKAPFGFWDSEGRRFRRYLNEIISSEDTVGIEMRGPHKDQGKSWPLLRNYERFKIPAPSHRKLKQALTRDELAWVISNMHRQPQHLIKPWFTGSNIAEILKVPGHLVRGFASYFYVKPLLLLLNLGPQRAHQFSYYLHKRYLDPSHEPKDEMLKSFRCEKTIFLTFVNKNFFEPLERDDDVAQQFRKYATILALWSRIVTELLKTWFQDNFVGEYDSVNKRYLPMALPDSYPKKAVEMAEEEEIEKEISVNEPMKESHASLDVAVHQKAAVAVDDDHDTAVDASTTRRINSRLVHTDSSATDTPEIQKAEKLSMGGAIFFSNPYYERSNKTYIDAKTEIATQDWKKAHSVIIEARGYLKEAKEQSKINPNSFTAREMVKINKRLIKIKEKLLPQITAKFSG
jgi:hypothetical protein